MTTLDHLGDPRVCAGLDHAIVTVSCHWCPHRQAWTVSRTAGAAEEPCSAEQWSLGPFDGTTETLGFALERLAEGLAAIELWRP